MIMNGAYAGRYKIQVIGANNTTITEIDWFDNLITNKGLDVYGGIATNTFGAYLGVGEAVAETDLSMTAVANTTRYTRTVATQTLLIPYWVRERHIFTFAVGAATGTITDVGVGWGTGIDVFTPLYSHALLPIPLVLTELDQVILTYDHYFCISDYSTFTLTLNGVETTGQCKPVGAFARHDISNSGVPLSFASPLTVFNFPDTCFHPYIWYSDAILSQLHQFSLKTATHTEAFSAGCWEFSQDTLVSTILSPYVSGSLSRQYTKTWYAEAGAFTNVNCVYIPFFYSLVAGNFGFIIRFDPPFTKTELQKLTISGEVSWNRTTVPE